MSNFFSFLKNRKILFFVFFVAIIFISTPHIYAETIGERYFLLGWENTTATGEPETPDVAESVSETKSWGEMLKPGSWLTSIGIGVVNGCYKLAKYSSIGLDSVINNFMNKAITTDDHFTGPWQQVRNLGNMLIVLGFVVVGIATALRVQTYAATKLLFPLILAALLINFSGLFCGLIIDASSLVTEAFIKGMSVPAADGSKTKLVTASAKLLETLVATSRGILDNTFALNYKEFFASCFLFGAVYLGVALTFLYLALLLIARYIILIMLYILSPLAFTFWIFPMSKHLWTDWWKHFLKWCFVGVFGSFVLYLATIMLSMQPLLNGKAATTVQLSDLFVQIIIVLGFLAIGFKMTAKSSGVAGMATAAVLGLATGGAALAAGSVGKLAGGLANKTGASRLGDKLSNSTGQVLEKFGWRQEGATAASATKKIKEKQDAVGNLSLDRQADLANKNPISHDAAQNKVAAIKNLVAKGELYRVGTGAQQKQAVAYAESYMKSRGLDAKSFRKESEGQSYQLAEENEDSVKKIMRDQGITNPAVAKTKLRNAKLDELMPNMNHGQLRGVDHADITFERLNKISPEKISAYRTGSSDQIRRIKDINITNIRPELQALRAQKSAGARIDQGRLTKLENMNKEIGHL